MLGLMSRTKMYHGERVSSPWASYQLQTHDEFKKRIRRGRPEIPRLSALFCVVKMGQRDDGDEEATMRFNICWLVLLFVLGGVNASLAVNSFTTKSVEYPSGHGMVRGFLAAPGTAGKHPGIVVIHEWWGLVPWVKEQTVRLAGQGYVALAVDLYRGESTTNPSQARQLMRILPEGRGLQDLEAAYNYLASRPDVDRHKIGSIGWCMGGGWSLRLAEHEPLLAACVVNYGELPQSSAGIRAIHAPLLGNFGADDRGIPPQAVYAFERAVKADGNHINVKIYPGAGHAFENPNNKSGFRPAAAQDAWSRTIAFLNAELK
jgi:carboxymethylenebutenolidase